MNLKQIGLLLVLLVTAGIISAVSKWSSPDLAAHCQKKATEAERKQCVDQVNLAMSAGW